MYWFYLLFISLGVVDNGMGTLEKPQFDGSRYNNPKSFTTWAGLPTFTGFFRWKFMERDDSKLPSKDILDQTLPIKKPQFNINAKFSATWLGHSTVYVRMGNTTFITDPVWAYRASPIRFFGPKRYRNSPCKISDIPSLNFALISHNHYDHLDKNAITELSERFPEMEWFVPIGLANWMKDYVNNNLVHELNWGEHKTIVVNSNKYQIWSVPAQHWSRRGLFDGNKSLWCGWAVLGPERKFLYTGDTGFCENEFRKIGDNLGPFDLAAIPVGCYSPRWFMKSQHIDPAEAVQIHKLVRANKSIGVHWGTYEMGATEGYLEPRSKLREEVEKANLRPIDFFTLGHGETWVENPNEQSSLITPTTSEISS